MCNIWWMVLGLIFLDSVLVGHLVFDDSTLLSWHCQKGEVDSYGWVPTTWSFIEKILMIGVMDIVLMSWLKVFCYSIFSTSKVMKSNYHWPLYLNFVSDFTFVPVSMMIFTIWKLQLLHFWVDCNVWLQFDWFYFRVSWNIIWWLEWYNNVCLQKFYHYKTQHFAGDLLPLIFNCIG